MNTYIRIGKNMFMLALLACALFVPVFTHAQQSDLQSTIRAAIAADPRTQGMSQAQIDAMVDALSQKAQSQGMMPNDITWRPVTNTTATTSISCGAFPTIFCTLSYSLGFIGTGSTIPAWLFFASLLMIILILLLRRQHFLHARAMAAAVPKQ